MVVGEDRVTCDWGEGRGGEGRGNSTPFTGHALLQSIYKLSLEAPLTVLFPIAEGQVQHWEAVTG